MSPMPAMDPTTAPAIPPADNDLLEDDVLSSVSSTSDVLVGPLAVDEGVLTMVL